MHYEALFKGAYIAAVELGDKSPTLRIKAVRVVAIEGEDGQTKDKGVVYFHETDRGWVLNRTNAQLLAAMFGNETDGWVGKRVTLHSQQVRFGPKTVPGIRVKGSPDLHGPVHAEVKLPRRKPKAVTLVNTGHNRPTGDTVEP